MVGQRPFHLLCLGPVWANLCSDQVGAALATTTSFSATVGGCGGAVAVGLSRLGLKCATLTRLGDDPMGRFVKAFLSDEGVNTSYLIVDTASQTPLALHSVSALENSETQFYHTSVLETTASLLALTLEDLQKCQAVLITGHLFATPALAKATKHVVDLAKEAKTAIILDIDRELNLWQPKTEERLRIIFKYCDLIIGNNEELCLAGNSHHLHGALERLHNESPATIVQKRGAQGCIVYGRELQDVTTAPGLQVKTLNGLGNGHAFTAGFLRGWLTEESIMKCCSWGNACGAIVLSRRGGVVSQPYWAELLAYLRQPISSSVVDINHQHFSLRNARDSKRPLCVLSFDHRTYFQSIIARKHRSERDIIQFKKLLFRATQQTIAHDLPVDHGIMIDDEYCQPLLQQVDPAQLWCSRCIDAPMSFPVGFLQGKEASLILRAWPRHHRVKVLTFQPSHEENQSYIPQTKALRHLYQACVEWGHQLVVEIMPHNDENDLVYPMEAMEAYYRAGIFPSWWQLPLPLPADVWARIDALIRRFDPYCRGVLVIGNNEPLSTVEERLKQWHQIAPIAGFAVGRSIWGEVAEQWFSREIEDDQVVSEVANRYSALIESFVNVPIKA